MDGCDWEYQVTVTDGAHDRRHAPLDAGAQRPM